jgi:hypothetical protein
MGVRGWGVLPVDRAHSKEWATLPSPAGDHEGHPYGLSGLLPLFMLVLTPICTLYNTIKHTGHG